jgi:hypothetical protein
MSNSEWDKQYSQPVTSQADMTTERKEGPKLTGRIDCVDTTPHSTSVVLTGTQPEPRGSEALLAQINALSRITPSELSVEEQWNRNGEYVQLYEVQRILLAAATAERTPPIHDMGVGDVAYGMAVKIIAGNFPSADKLGPYIAKFAIDYANGVTADRQPAPPDGRRAPQCPKCGSYKLHCHNNGCTWEIPSGAS